MMTIIIHALIVASVSFTITTTSIFEGFRELVSKLHHKIDELIHCPWCLGHWLIIGLLPLTGYTYPITEWYLVNFILTVFMIMTPVGLFHYILLIAYQPVSKAAGIREMKRRKIEQSRKSRIALNSLGPPPHE